MNKLYPLKFKPILKERIWGGNALNYKSKRAGDSDKIGESWELSGVEGSVSIIENGSLKGKSLVEVLKTYNEDLIGKANYKRFGEEFPLLIKFIDAKENLSVQLHPDDTIARAKHGCMGKTEMWYIMKAKDDAFIIADFKGEISKEDYKKRVEENNLQDALKYVNVRPGDFYFIAPGLIHAIGEGVMLAEIQQTSDITYRIYDWDRVDDEGNSRELHQQEALDAIDFTPKEPKVEYLQNGNVPNQVVYNTYFKTDYLPVESNCQLELSDKDSFTILINVGSDAELKYDGKTYDFKNQETYLLPAIISEIELKVKAGKFLMVHI
jgi:mannose-6-phosphate isomerase